MIKNHRIIFLQTLPWNWTADFQKQTASILSKNNLIIVYSVNNQQSAIRFIISLFKKIYLLNHSQNNIIFHNQVIFFPNKRFTLLKKLNSWINYLYLFTVYKPSFLWTSDPRTYIPYKLINLFRQNKLLYDCSDYHWHPNPREDQLIKTNEKKLIEESNFFIVNSYSLHELHKKIKTPDAVVPQGFAVDNFSKEKLSTLVSQINKTPTLGFIGGINYRLDISLISNLINNNPNWNFVFVGPKQLNQIPGDQKVFQQLDKLFERSNVKYIDSIPREEIGNYIQSFDIGFIPYDISYRFNLYCYPMKLFEYFYFGKPVISSPIKELMLPKFKDLVYIANDVLEWEKHIKILISAQWGQDKKSKQKKMAVDNSWERKVKAICDIVSPN